MRLYIPILFLFSASSCLAEQSLYIHKKSNNVSFGLSEDELPRSVDVVIEEQYDGFNSVRLEDALDETTAVLAGRSSAGIAEDVSIRGFSIHGKAYLDGLVDNRHYLLRDPSTVDHIEIIKGHDSSLFGIGSPGGTVNYLSKRPLWNKQTNLTASIASPSTTRLSFDTTDAVDANKNIRYRIISTLQKGTTDKSHVDDDRLLFFPSVLWRYSDRGELLLDMQLHRQNRTYDFDTLFNKGEVVYDVSYTDPRASSKRKAAQFSFNLNQMLSDNSRLNVKANYHRGKRDEKLVGYAYRLDESTLAGYYREVKDDYMQYSVQASLDMSFKVGRSAHKLKLGAEKNYSRSDTKSLKNINGFQLDIYSPSFDYALPTELKANDYRSYNNEKALIFSDNIAFGSRWMLQTGLRYSHFDSTFDWYTGGQTFKQTDNNFLASSIGLNYKLNDNSSFYSSRSASFKPNSGKDKNHHFFDPKRGLQFELGLRHSSPDKKLNLQGALYKITQDNLTMTDPNDKEFSVLLGKVETKGLELHLDYQFRPSSTIALNYSYMDGTIKRNSDGLEGNTPHSIPQHSGSLVLTHQQKSGMLAGLKTKLITRYVDKRPGDDKNSFEIPSYINTKLQFQYPVNKNSLLKVSINNVFDKRFATYAVDADTIRQGKRRSLHIGVEYKF